MPHMCRSSSKNASVCSTFSELKHNSPSTFQASNLIGRSFFASFCHSQIKTESDGTDRRQALIPWSFDYYTVPHNDTEKNTTSDDYTETRQTTQPFLSVPLPPAHRTCVPIGTASPPPPGPTNAAGSDFTLAPPPPRPGTPPPLLPPGELLAPAPPAPASAADFFWEPALPPLVPLAKTPATAPAGGCAPLGLPFPLPLVFPSLVERRQRQQVRSEDGSSLSSARFQLIQHGL